MREFVSPRFLIRGYWEAEKQTIDSAFIQMSPAAKYSLKLRLWNAMYR